MNNFLPGLAKWNRTATVLVFYQGSDGKDWHTASPSSEQVRSHRSSQKVFNCSVHSAAALGWCCKPLQHQEKTTGSSLKARWWDKFPGRYRDTLITWEDKNNMMHKFRFMFLRNTYLGNYLALFILLLNICCWYWQQCGKMKAEHNRWCYNLQQTHWLSYT